MRRSLIAIAFLAACAKGEAPADTTAATPAPATPAPLTLADIAGTWDNKVMPLDKDTVLTTSEATISETGAATSKLADGTIITGTLVLAGDSVVAEAQGFKSQLRKGQTVSNRQVQRLRDGKLVGLLYAKYSNGDSVTFRVEGTRRTKAP